MKPKIIFLLLVIFSLMLVACGGSDAPVAEPVVEEEPAVVEEPAVEEVAEEPVEEVAEELAEEPAEGPMEEMAEADLDGAFSTYLDEMEAYSTIGLDAFSELIATDPPFILDVRELGELEQSGYIEGAVHIPLREVADHIELLPSLDTPIVVYCASGWRATIAAAALEGMGWESVRALKAPGFPSFTGWVEAGYPAVEGVPEAVELGEATPDVAMVKATQEMLHNVPEGFGVLPAEKLATDLIENPDLVVIDVRRPEEVESLGYMDAPNILHIPLEELVANQALWPEDLDTPIVTYCKGGNRSTIAMSILWSYGYTNVRSLKGGFDAWVAEGYPGVNVPEAEEVAFDMDAAFNTFLADMEGYNTIGLEDLNLMLVEDPPPFILDVREVSELEAKGHIEGAINIPLRELADNLQYLPSFDTQIISYCGSGWRCTIALTALEALGWEDVKCLKGGSFGGWVEAGYPVVEGVAAEPMELNAVEPAPAAVAAMQEMLHNVPDDFGGISADDLFLAAGESPDLILIDARTSTEVEEKGIIEAANWIHISLEEFVNMKDMWPAELDAPIVVYCGSGHRSTIGMTILWSYGYTDVLSLKGGFGAWVEAGYPVAEFVAE